MHTEIDYGLVSIIMPSYNTARFITETIESVLGQTYRNWELIIVDDASKDETDSVVEKYLANPKISYIKNESNMGAAYSRNKAIDLAKGKWIAFLDSDDLWSPEKLFVQIKFMVDNDVHFSYTQYEEIDEDGSVREKIITGPKKINKYGMYAYCWIGCLTVIYNCDYVGKIHIFDIKKNNDYAMWLKVIKKANCYLCPNNLAKYRKRKGSISNHNYKKLIIWHYRLWREAEDKSVFTAIFLTGVNIVCGAYKKLFYTKNVAKEKNKDEF